jgi:hypothetical protein
MKHLTSLLLGGLLLSACGAGANDGGNPGFAFAGTLGVTSPLPAGTTTCQATTLVTFSNMGADIHIVSLAGGGCLEFLNTDTAPHRPASFGATVCPELNGPSLATSARYTTPPLNGPVTCQWQDALTPLPPGGGNGY